MQRTRVWSLVWEDTMCLRATKPLQHKYWACALTCALQQQYPQQWEACTQVSRNSLLLATARESPRAAKRGSAQPKKKKRLSPLDWPKEASKCQTPTIHQPSFSGEFIARLLQKEEEASTVKTWHSQKWILNSIKVRKKLLMRNELFFIKSLFHAYDDKASHTYMRKTCLHHNV